MPSLSVTGFFLAAANHLSRPAIPAESAFAQKVLESGQILNRHSTIANSDHVGKGASSKQSSELRDFFSRPARVSFQKGSAEQWIRFVPPVRGQLSLKLAHRRSLKQIRLLT